MRNLLLLLILTLVLSCNRHEHRYEEFTFEFYRSFESDASFTFDLERENLKIVKSENNGDTSYLGMFEIQKDKITKLFTDINNIDYQNDTLNVTGRRGLDGQVFALLKMTELDTHYIVSHNPRRKIEPNRNFQNDYEVLNILFDFISTNIVDSSVTSLSKELYRGYGCELQFKKIANSPLEYSIWGVRVDSSIENDNLNLASFFRNLPESEPVIIELNTVGPSEYTSFSKEQQDNLYFYGDDYLEYLEEGYLYQSEQENADIPWYIVDTLFLKYCTVPETCDFKNGNHANHLSYHEWNERKVELKKFWGQYFMTREEVIDKIEK